MIDITETWLINVDLTAATQLGCGPEDNELLQGLLDNYVMATIYPLMTNLKARLTTRAIPVVTQQEQMALALSYGIPHEIDTKRSNLDHYRLLLKPSQDVGFKVAPGAVMVFNRNKEQTKMVGVLTATFKKESD